MVRLVILAVLTLAAAAAVGDVVTLVSGAHIEGRIVRETAEEIELKTALGVAVFQRKEIASIEAKPWAEADAGATKAGGPRGRLPDAKAVRRAISGKAWARGIKQIPATVVTKGPFKNVPYVSWRADEDYEINVYGNPEAPVAIEVGLLNMRTRDDAARKNAQAFLAGILATREDREVVEKLGREREDQVREGLTFQVAGPEAEFAYHAWWVRMEDERTMDMERAGPDEVSAIAQMRGTQAPLPRPGSAPVRRPRNPTAKAPGGDPWSGEEMRYARDLPEAQRGMARVYVREFVRNKEGKYERANEKEE